MFTSQSSNPSTARNNFLVRLCTAEHYCVLLLRARRPGIHCQTVFVTQLWVLAFSGDTSKNFFAKYWRDVLSTLEIFLWECTIQIYSLLTYLVTRQWCCVQLKRHSSCQLCITVTSLQYRAHTPQCSLSCCTWLTDINHGMWLLLCDAEHSAPYVVGTWSN